MPSTPTSRPLADLPDRTGPEPANAAAPNPGVAGTGTAPRSVTTAAGRTPPGAATDPGAPRWLALAPALAALVICVIPLFWAQHLTGAFSYDEGAYVGSAVELAHGLIPYRDFAFVQPPGITIFLLPVAALGRVLGLGTQDVTAIARVLTVLATALSSGLAALAMRHRGVVGMMVAGGALAAFPLAYTSFSSTLLEPYLDALCLLGVVLLFEHGSPTTRSLRLYGAGLVFGLAVGFKIWALIPAGLGLLWTLRSGWRSTLRYAAGGATGVVVIFGPFLAASPVAFLRDVFQAQADRLNFSGLGFSRLVSLTGVKYLRFPTWSAWALVGFWIALLLAVHVPPLTSRGAHSGLSRGGRHTVLGRSLDGYVAATAIVVLVLLMLGHPYFAHYANILAPWVAMVAGSLVARAIGVVAGRARPERPERVARLLSSIALAAMLLVVVLIPIREYSAARRHDPAPHNAAILRLVAATSPSTCVVSDDSSLVEAANRFATAGTRCPVVVDSLGIRLVAQAAHGDSARTERALALQWQRTFSHAQLVYLTRRFHRRIPWPPWLAAWFQQHFRRVQLPAVDETLGWLYQRR